MAVVDCDAHRWSEGREGAGLQGIGNRAMVSSKNALPTELKRRGIGGLRLFSGSFCLGSLPLCHGAGIFWRAERYEWPEVW